MAAAYQAYVTKILGLGFSKVTIINRANYAPIAYSSAKDVASGWRDKDEYGREVCYYVPSFHLN